jgi:DNA-binding NtrC family response regulator
MSTAPHILIVDDEPDIRHLLQEILQDEGYSVAIAEDAANARHQRRQQRPDLILLDIWMPDVDGITLLKEWSEQEPLTQPVIMMSGHGTVETAVEATRLGAFDYIEKPLSLAKLLLTVRHALEHYHLQRENQGLRHAVQPLDEPIGRSQRMQMLRQQAQQLAQHDTPVLLSGEAGSGRELFARYIHQHSPRRDASFVNLDLSLPVEELTTRLFGNEQAQRLQYGLLDEAQGGTLYINDVCRLSAEHQLTLLQLLQQGSFHRQGGEQLVSCDVRVIAATREPLEQRVVQGHFNHDLFYQLNVVRLSIPALREHSEDVLDLVAYYSDHYVETEKLPYRSFSTAALNRLRQYEWPGNIRELKNLIQRLLILGQSQQVDLAEVEEALAQQARALNATSNAYALPLRQAREQFEHDYFAHLLRRYQGSVHKVAQHAEVERTHLYRKLRSLGLDAKEFG